MKLAHAGWRREPELKAESFPALTHRPFNAGERTCKPHAASALEMWMALATRPGRPCEWAAIIPGSLARWTETCSWAG